MNFAKGYLTYTLATLAVITGVGGFVLGIIEQEAAVGLIWSGLVVFGLRRAL